MTDAEAEGESIAQQNGKLEEFRRWFRIYKEENHCPDRQAAAWALSELGLELQD